jgi:uncharacterized OsmC-like protein
VTTLADIQSAVRAAVRFLTEHPDEARYTDSEATATLEEGLRVRVQGPGGEAIDTDMPASVGGDGSGPSAGWLFRASLASCVASLIAMRAAEEGVELTNLKVTVDSESDDRGILGMDPGIPTGPLSMRIRVEASAGDGRSLDDIVDSAIARCPVYDAARRPVEITVER